MQPAIAIGPKTLADTLTIPRLSPLMADALRVAAGVALVSALAQLAVPLPFTPVPLTGQTLGVLLCGLMLGSRRGAMALGFYLLLGAAGLPVYAGAGVGMTHLVGPTAGYLWVFPIAAFLVGWLAERGWDRRPLTAALAMALGCLLILLAGSLWLSLYVGGLASGLAKGCLPFLPGEAIKVLMVAGFLPGLWVTRRNNRSV